MQMVKKNQKHTQHITSYWAVLMWLNFMMMCCLY